MGEVQNIIPVILSGGDPLGDFFVGSVSPEERRNQGATFTPSWVVELQIEQIAAKVTPARVIDAGAGTGRYALAAARRWPGALIVAVEKDPVLADVIRINARAAGLSIQTICTDYLGLTLPRIDGVTAFIGNPPYVRHHDISAKDKAWYSAQMKQLGLPHSQLAGLHIYFFLKSFQLSKPADVGSFIAAAEWMETNYGASMRGLFCRMGGDSLVRVHPGEQIFPDALTSSVIAGWTMGSNGEVRVCDLVHGAVQSRFQAARREWEALSKWPGFGQPMPALSGVGPVLGDLFQVSRGQVTGHNEVWIASAETERLIPERYLFPCVTDAREVFGVDSVLLDASRLKRVIDLPEDLSELSAAERKRVDSFLERASFMGAADSYVAQHRKPWWRVRLKSPPAIIMSYMGRRAPRFVRNACGARLINIAHGLTPLRPVTVAAQDRLVEWLNSNVTLTAGRTYGGGMVKFEPGDAMRIPLPAGEMYRWSS